MQRDVVATLHQQLAHTSDQLQQEVQEWQDQCAALEKDLSDVRAEAHDAQQELKTRPTGQQVTVPGRSAVMPCAHTCISELYNQVLHVHQQATFSRQAG